MITQIGGSVARKLKGEMQTAFTDENIDYTVGLQVVDPFQGYVYENEEYFPEPQAVPFETVFFPEELAAGKWKKQKKWATKRDVKDVADSVNNLHTQRESIEWRSGLKVNDALQLYLYDGKEYLPNKDSVPFTTGQSFADDLGLGRFDADVLLSESSVVEVDLTTAKSIRDWFVYFWNWTKNLGKQKVLSKGSTTARSLEDRFSDALDVKDFGGVDGGDITEAVQRMVNAATAGQSCVISTNGAISGTIQIPPTNGLKIITLGTISSDMLDYIFESNMPIKTYTSHIVFEGGVYNSSLFLRINDSTQELLPDSNPSSMGYCGHLHLKNIAIRGGYDADINKPVIHLTKCPQVQINNVSIGSCNRGIVLEGCDLPYLHATNIAAYRVSGMELITRDAAYGAQGYIHFCELLSPRRGGIGIISSDRDVRIEHNYFEPTRDPETDEPSVACIKIQLSDDPAASKTPPRITVAHNRIDGATNRPDDRPTVTNWLLLDVAPLRSYIVNNRSVGGFTGAVKFPDKVSYWHNPVDRRYITANSNNPSDTYPMRYTQQEVLPLNEYARYNPNLDGILYNGAQGVGSLAHYVRGGVFVLESNPDFLRVDLTQYGRLPSSVNVWVLAKTVGSSAKLTVHYNNGMGTETFTKWELGSHWKWINVNNNAALYADNATLGFSNEDTSSGVQADIEIAEVIFTGIIS